MTARVRLVGRPISRRLSAAVGRSSSATELKEMTAALGGRVASWRRRLRSDAPKGVSTESEVLGFCPPAEGTAAIPRARIYRRRLPTGSPESAWGRSPTSRTDKRPVPPMPLFETACDRRRHGGSANRERLGALPPSFSAGDSTSTAAETFTPQSRLAD